MKKKYLLNCMSTILCARHHICRQRSRSESEIEDGSLNNQTTFSHFLQNPRHDQTGSLDDIRTNPFLPSRPIHINRFSRQAHQTPFVSGHNRTRQSTYQTDDTHGEVSYSNSDQESQPFISNTPGSSDNRRREFSFTDIIFPQTGTNYERFRDSTCFFLLIITYFIKFIFIYLRNEMYTRIGRR